MPRKELRGFSLSGEVGAEVVLLEGLPPAAVMSAPSLDVELGRGGPSRGVMLPSLTTDNTVKQVKTGHQGHSCMNGKMSCGLYGPVLYGIQCLSHVSSGNEGNKSFALVNSDFPANKGSLTQDFQLQVFFMNQFPPGP